MQNKMLAGFIIAVVAVGAGSFYGGTVYGMAYGKCKGVAQNETKNFQNFSGQGGQMGNGQGRVVGNRAANGSFVNGDVIAKDDKSITVKSMDGGSKIIFLSSTTQINKSVTGALSDLEIGKNVMVTGTTNPDGSLTAKSVELRTDMPALISATSTPIQ